MAAEDYFDPADFDLFDERDPDTRDAILNFLYMKNMRQGKIWRCGDGTKVHVRNMEDNHLQNTILYITRKMEDWKLVEMRGRQNGQKVPPYFINNRPGEVWLEVMMKEQDRRARRKS